MNMRFELADAKTVGITGHVRPDGDCVGSVMGLYNYIKKNMPNIEVDAYLEQPGKEFDYIKNLDQIKNSIDINNINEIANSNEINIINNIKQLSDAAKQYDVFIVLDCSDTERIKPFAQLFINAKKTICIDHHASNNAFADINLVRPNASSSCEVLYGTLEEAEIDKDIAECIYTGIIHDTGVFKYSCTSEDTMAIAGKLMAKGIDYSDIIDNSFYKKTYIQNQVLGRALLESVLFYDGKCIFSAIYKKDMDFYGVDGKQLGGIIEQLRLTEGVEVAIFLYETGMNEYKVSMRSKKYINVSSISVHFGGGGHIRAAGVTMQGTVHDIINNIGAQLELQFNSIGKE